MRRTRRYTLIAGLALVGLTNAVLLGGVAYNRSGEPDSSLRLTERELRPPYEWANRKENSGLELRLHWRVLQADDPNARLHRVATEGGGTPAWLDESKMASLGFDMARSTQRIEQNEDSAFERQLPRDVLVVLELEGPTYRMALERAADATKEAETTNEHGTGKKAAVELMDRETHRSSRLFAVDAGLDRAALRRRYPDRAQYAIVRGQVRPARLEHSNWQPAGVITDLGATAINVPLAMHDAFKWVAPNSAAIPTEGGTHIDARLAIGQRLEPWLISAAR